MKVFLASLSVCLTILLVGALILLALQFSTNRSLLQTRSQLAQDLQTANLVVDQLTNERQKQNSKLADLKEATEQLRSRIDELESNSPQGAATVPRPYRVRAFVGNESVDGAWIIPSNARKDPETGKYTYEQVLWFDESAKKTFTTHHTNVVEKPVQTTSVNNYYPDTGSWRYPVWGWGGGYPPLPPVVDPTPPVNPVPPVAPVGQVNGFHDINANMFSPVMGRVNSRPQILGRPATSTVNANMFSPIP